MGDERRRPNLELQIENRSTLFSIALTFMSEKRAYQFASFLEVQLHCCSIIVLTSRNELLGVPLLLTYRDSAGFSFLLTSGCSYYFLL